MVLGVGCRHQTDRSHRTGVDKGRLPKVFAHGHGIEWHARGIGTPLGAEHFGP